MPGLALLGASLVVAALDAGAGAAEFGVRFGAGDQTLLLAMFCVAAVGVASDERAWTGAVSSVAEPEVGAGSAAVALPGVELPGVEWPTLESLDLREELLGSDGGAACVSSSAGMSGAGVIGAGTDGDWTIGDWSSAKMVAPVGIGAWGWLSADGGAAEAAVAGVDEIGAGETGVSEARAVGVGEMGVSDARAAGVGETGVSDARAVGVGETGVSEARAVGVGETGVSEARAVGVGETGPEGVENSVGAVKGRVGTLGNACAASEAAWPVG